MSRAGEGRAIRKACERGLPSAEPLCRLRFWGRFKGVWEQAAFPGGEGLPPPGWVQEGVWSRDAPWSGEPVGSHEHRGFFRCPGLGTGLLLLPLFPAWLCPRGPKDARITVPSLALCNRTGGRLRLYLAGGCPFLIKPSPG